MADHDGSAGRGRPVRVRMTARDAGEPHRVATPLELFFDLCFVVAVAQVSAQFHHYVSHGDAAVAVPSYVAVFFAIWWAWMNFTWFASAYDTDDVPYRIAALVTVVGALVLAAGVPRAFETHDFAVVAGGYAIMRLALITLWLRAARSHPAGRATAVRYALGLGFVQALWIGWLFLPAAWRMPSFPAVAVLDMLVPLFAERTGRTAWHPHHIAERYGAFTIIVLGESVASATVAVQSAVDSAAASGALFLVAAGGLLTVFAMWWLYFAKPAHAFLGSSGHVSFVWGYGHYFVFASATAVGAGIAVNVDSVAHRVRLSQAAAGAAFTVPVAVFLLTLWFLQIRPHRGGPAQALIYPGAALLVLACGFTGAPVPATGLITAALVAAGIAADAGRGRGPGTAAG
jgi:low temperature requirement protein LtrA